MCQCQPKSEMFIITLLKDNEKSQDANRVVYVERIFRQLLKGSPPSVSGKREKVKKKL